MLVRTPLPDGGCGSGAHAQIPCCSPWTRKGVCQSARRGGPTLACTSAATARTAHSSLRASRTPLTLRCCCAWAAPTLRRSCSSAPQTHACGQRPSRCAWRASTASPQHSSCASRGSAAPPPLPRRVFTESLLEPTHGKPTKIALQASPGEQPLASGTFPARQSCAVHHLPSEQPLLMWLSGALSTVAHHTRRRRRAARSASGPGTRTRHRRRAMPSTGCRCDNRTATSIHMCRHTLCSIICATRSQVGAARLPWLLRQAGGEGGRTKRIYRRAWWWTSWAEYRTQACGRRARSPSALSVTRKCATWPTRW